MSTSFQRIVFLIRDWPYPREFPFGSQGGKAYIDDYLKTSEENESTELDERRKQIRQFFSKVDCYLMPKPGEKIETDQSDSNSRLSGKNMGLPSYLMMRKLKSLKLLVYNLIINLHKFFED